MDAYARRMVELSRSGVGVSVTLDATDPSSPTIPIVYPETCEPVEVPAAFRTRVSKETLDPEGVFFVNLDREAARIRVEWYRHTKLGEEVELAEIYRGVNAPSLYDTLVARHPSMRPSTAAALAYELSLLESDLKPRQPGT